MASGVGVAAGWARVCGILRIRVSGFGFRFVFIVRHFPFEACRFRSRTNEIDDAVSAAGYVKTGIRSVLFFKYILPTAPSPANWLASFT